MIIGSSLARLLVASRGSIFVMILIILSSCTTLNSQRCTKDSFRDSISHKCVYRAVGNMPRYISNHSLVYDMMHQLSQSPFDKKDIPHKLELEFIVDKDGNVSAVRIFGKGNDNLSPFEEYAIKAFSKLQNWQAGSHNGKNVNVLMRQKFIIDTF